MGRKRASGDKPQKKKDVTVKLLERKHGGLVTTANRLMDELVEAHHDHLLDAKIAIAWRFAWKPDVDGRLKLCSVKKGGDLDRELHGFDFVILLNHEAWNQSGFNEPQMRALIDHALCKCQVSKDAAGEPRIDENNRTVYRLRQPDVQEFSEIIRRHGAWTADLERFASAVRDAKSRPLFDSQHDDEPRPTLPLGVPRSQVENQVSQEKPATAADAAPKKRGRPPKAHKPPANVRPPLQRAAGH